MDVKLIGVILYVKSIIDSRFIFVLNWKITHTTNDFG